jgi:small conductance mechanosensitive channel
MLGSLVTYIGFAFLGYRCMVCFGLNPTALMASAGIVSVVIGIGANSLVGDILAGIFLLMEGNIQVGDVVKIGDFRGYIQEMGIRMTKLFDMETYDVKIIPNKEVQNVVHMTMHTAIVYSTFMISYEEDLERVEKLLKEELSTMAGNVPYIRENPRYLGVSLLDSNGVVLKVATRCHEAFRMPVERLVNRRIYVMFKRNGITIPYPQLTTHAAPPEEKKEAGETEK